MDDSSWQSLRSRFKDKKILIVGLGLQGGGVGLAKFFVDLEAKVSVTDKKTEQQLLESVNRLKDHDIRFTLGQHKEADFMNADIIFKGPSVSWRLPQLVSAKKKGVPVEMESSFFMSLCPAPIIGITGTRGKTTIIMMIYELAKLSGKKVHLAGNIPQTSTINLLPSIKQNDLVIMELSSWQLAGFHRKKISPHIAVFTNFFPDHLNLYSSLDEYLHDKKAIYLYQKPDDFLVINESLKKVGVRTESTFSHEDWKIDESEIKSKVIFFNSRSFPGQLLHLKGVHNLENAGAAFQVSQILGIDPLKSIALLKSFKSVPYRQQTVEEKNGVIFINDTTSTTPTATIKALEAFSDKPIVLILGGNSKNLPFQNLINQLIKSEKIVLLKGSFTDEILPVLKEKYPEKITEPFDDLEKAVQKAYEEAKHLRSNIKHPTAIILFSPGATSFAMFNNEFHRGDEFNKIVNNITRN